MDGRWMMGIAAALALSACGDGSRAGGNGAPADTATAPAAQAPAADTAPAAAAWVLDENGIGPLRVGMTVEEAKTALGGRFAIRGVNPDPTACTYADVPDAPAGVQVMLEAGKVARVEVDSGATATARGARIGDAAARIGQLYPNPRAMPHKYTAGQYLVVVSPDTTRRIVFETDSAGVVTRFRGGVTPAVEYVEGCS